MPVGFPRRHPELPIEVFRGGRIQRDFGPDARRSPESNFALSGDQVGLRICKPLETALSNAVLLVVGINFICPVFRGVDTCCF